MTFITALLILLLFPMVFLTKSLLISGAASEMQPPQRSIYEIYTLIPGVLASCGFMLGILEASAQSANFNDANYIPHWIMAGGVVGVIVFPYIVYRRVSVTTSSKRLAVGPWIVCAMTSAYLTYTAIDHFIFLADKESSGVLSAQIAREVGIDCAAPYLLVRKEGNKLAYRCRHNLQLGGQLGQPFIPWPAYTSGTSEALAQALKKLEMESAVNR